MCALCRREHVGGAPICQMSLEVCRPRCKMREWCLKCVDVGNAGHGEHRWWIWVLCLCRRIHWGRHSACGSPTVPQDMFKNSIPIQFGVGSWVVFWRSFLFFLSNFFVSCRSPQTISYLCSTTGDALYYCDYFKTDTYTWSAHMNSAQKKCVLYLTLASPA
jgi:hypothetical protein